MPTVAPTISAAMITIKEIPQARRTPVKIWGRLAGRTMPLKISISLAPREREARIRFVSMLLAPAKVLRMTGKEAASAITKIFDPSPMPTQRMASGKRASGEIGLSSSTSGSKKSLSGRTRAIAAKRDPDRDGDSEATDDAEKARVKRLPQISTRNQNRQIGKGFAWRRQKQRVDQAEASSQLPCHEHGQGSNQANGRSWRREAPPSR